MENFQSVAATIITAMENGLKTFSPSILQARYVPKKTTAIVVLSNSVTVFLSTKYLKNPETMIDNETTKSGIHTHLEPSTFFGRVLSFIIITSIMNNVATQRTKPIIIPWE